MEVEARSRGVWAEMRARGVVLRWHGGVCNAICVGWKDRVSRVTDPCRTWMQQQPYAGE